MERKKKISIMIVVILLMQVLLPMLTVVFENDLTLFSRAEGEENTWDISATENDHVTATFNEEIGTLTISGTGNMREWSLSDTPWYAIRKKIKTVIIEKEVKNIGASAFFDCVNLVNVRIQDGMTTIGASAFRDCTNLKSVEVPDSVTNIMPYAFCQCANLANIKIPEHINKIDQDVFYGCKNLTSIDIPSEVQSISYSAFNMCGLLKSINVHENNKFYLSENGVLYSKTKDRIVRYPEGKEGTSYSISKGVTKNRRIIKKY